MNTNKALLISNKINIETAITLAKSLNKPNLISDAQININIFNKTIVCKKTWLNFFLSPYFFFKYIRIIKNSNKVIFINSIFNIWILLIAKLLFKEIIFYQLDAKTNKLNQLAIRFSNAVFFTFPQTKIKNTNKYCFGFSIEKEFEFSFIKKDKVLNISIILDKKNDYIENTFINLPKNILKNINIKTNLIKNNWLEEIAFKNLSYEDNMETLINSSHLIITNASIDMISKISSSGRPSFFICKNETEKTNAKYYQKLTNESDSLDKLITNIHNDDKFFYKTCEKVASAFASFAKQKIIKKIK